MGVWVTGFGGVSAEDIYGISGAVDNYGDLPAASGIDEGTIYVVRNAAGAPSGNGLYWSQSGAWAFLDALNMQDSDEVPNQSAVVGVTVTNALDTLGTAPPAHDLGGAEHNADTLANLNSKVSDATLIDTTDSRLSDDRDPNLHGLGDAGRHSSATLAQLNTLVSDATLDDTTTARTPTSHASTHDAGGGDAMAIDAVAGTGSLRTLGTGATNACAGNDARLSDARTPTSHASTHDAGGGDAMAIDAVAGTGSLRTLGTGATNACAGNDARLSDARTPTSHASSHDAGGGDAMAIDAVAGTGSLRTLGTGATNACAGNDARLSDARTPTSHASSHDAGGGDAMAIDAVAGTGSLRTLGTGATNACAGNDARLSDARTPLNHASNHTDGTDDVADLVGDGGGGGTHGLVPAPGAGDAAGNKYLKADGTWAVPSVISANSLQIIAGTDVDITMTFTATTNSGQYKWMEDEDYFEFSDDIFMADGENIIADTTTGTKIGTATSQKLGFFNATPVVQQNGTGETVGFVAGTGTAVNDDSTFTGNVGSTAYRISDVVKGLKNLGLLAS